MGAAKMAENSPASPDGPNDFVLEGLTKAVSDVIEFDPHKLATQINEDLKVYLERLTPNAPSPYDPTPAAKDNQAKSALRAAKLTLDTAKIASEQAYDVAVTQAQATYSQARDGWSAALRVYSAALTSAKLTFTSAVINEVESYEDKSNQDSKSRDQMLYQLLMQQAGTSLQSSTAAGQSAATTLAAAAGVVIEAFATYVTTVEGAVVTKITTDAGNLQTYWSAVETTLDATS
jgi:hypothetical protein